MILEKTTLSRARLFLFNLLLWLPWTCGANTTNSITGYPAVTSMAGGDEFLIGQQIGPTNWQLRTIQASNAPSFGSVAITSNSIAAAGILGNNTTGFAASSGTAETSLGFNDYPTIYCELNGSDTNSGFRTNSPVLTLTNAQAIARTLVALGYQPTIHLGKGWFIVTNTYIDLINYSIEGEGHPPTVLPYDPLTGQNNVATNQGTIGGGGFMGIQTNGTVISIDGVSTVALGDNCRLRNLAVYQNILGHHPVTTVGGLPSLDGDHALANWTTLTTTNCLVENCDLYGFFVYTVGLNSTNTMQIRFSNDHILLADNNCPLECGGFPVPPIANVSSNNSIVLENCYLAAGTNSGGAEGLVGTVYVGNSINLQMIGGSVSRWMNPNDLAMSTNIFNIAGTNSTIELANVKIYGSTNTLQVHFRSTAANDAVKTFGLCVNPNSVLNEGTGCLINDQQASLYNLATGQGISTNITLVGGATLYITNGVIVFYK